MIDTPHWRIQTLFSSVLIGLALLLSAANPLLAQGGEATLAGLVNDASRAIVAAADVALTNQATGEKQIAKSTSDGLFAFTALRPGTYTVSVALSGFSTSVQKDITVQAAACVSVPNIVLKPGSTSSTVEVTGAAALVPTDTEEKSFDITTNQIENVAIEGRNTVELLKIVPGAVNFGGYNGEAVGIQNGTNQFSINGIRTDSISNVFDGADVEDPGCNCGAFATPNREFVSEVQIQTSNFGAETVKGPVVIQSISKSGTRDFHGEGYYYVRDTVLNANDAGRNATGAPRPDTRYQYPGFNIGGSVLIPGTRFNKERNKLFFFGGAEWQCQTEAPILNYSFVPTAAMRTGDFSQYATGGFANSGAGVQNAPCDPRKGPLASYCASAYVLSPTAIDPSMQNYFNKIIPQPNINPAQNNGNNYASGVPNTDNRLQILVRGDYNISDSLKLYVRYNRETESPVRTYGLWWAGNVPFPGNIQGNNVGNSISSSLVKTFSPTITNEAVVSIGRLAFSNTLGSPNAVSPTGVGFNHRLVYGSSDNLIPNMNLGDVNGGNYVSIVGRWQGTANPASKWVNSAADNLAWAKGRHLLKFGAYYEYITNEQASPHPEGAFPQGDMFFSTSNNPNTSGNTIADVLLGRLAGFDQASRSPNAILGQNEISFYAQDSWKVTNKLTINYGLRVYHLGQMYDKASLFAVFAPNAYQGPVCSSPGILGCGTGALQNSYSGGTALLNAYSGLLNAKNDPWIPRSGDRTPIAEFGPRFGFAYDLNGHGTTVCRGGFGAYYNHDRDNPVYDSEANPPTAFGYSTGFTSLSALDGLTPAATVSSLGSILDPSDSRLPLVYEYNFTISHRLTSTTLVEASYIGNSSHNEQINGQNINLVPIGAELAAWNSGNSAITGAINDQNYRFFGNYSQIQTIKNYLTANYNAAQIHLSRHVGRISLDASYTFSKALGTGDGVNDAGYATVDPFDARHRSYGPLTYDRTHQLQLGYVFALPGLDKSRSRVLREVVNGWSISGITQLQSGAPIQTGIGLNGLNQNAITGTPDERIAPVLSCNPTSNLTSHQLFNASCFGTPGAANAGGTYHLPYIPQTGNSRRGVQLLKHSALDQLQHWHQPGK